MVTPPHAPDTTLVEGEARVTAAAGAVLVVGNGQMRVVPFTGDELLVGRAPECDVIVEHRALSRRHAIVRRKSRLTLQDLGSTNGTRLGERVLRGGDAVGLDVGAAFHIGPFSFIVVAPSAGDTSSQKSGVERLVVADPSVERVAPLIQDIARSGVNVLIQGETGVGKEVLATSVHALSGRPGPLTRINCAALSESLLESELFGHDKGAFTGAVAAKAGLLEAAAGGTVFLDEIGELPLGIQAKLLRAIEAREILRLGSTRPVAIDVRFIAATNRDLPSEVAAGRFRHDLFFRLDGVTLRIPPLRERPGMIGPLALGFLEESAGRLGRGAMRASSDLIPALEAHDWPGNVRELKAVIDRAVLLARGGELGARHLAFAPRGAEAPASSPPPVTPPVTPPSTPGAAAAGEPSLDFLTPEQREDRARLLAVLDACAGNQTRAARQLGISRTTLVNKLALYRIPRPRG